MNCFKFVMSKFKLTQNYKPVPVQPGPDIGQIQVQKWKNQTSNSSKLKFVHQSWTHLYTPKNMNFWDHNLGLTQQSQFYLIYSVTHMDSYRSKLVFWPLFKRLETCASRFVMGSTVHFIFWKNVQTKWIFEFWPYFQKIPMWKH